MSNAEITRGAKGIPRAVTDTTADEVEALAPADAALQPGDNAMRGTFAGLIKDFEREDRAAGIAPRVAKAAADAAALVRRMRNDAGLSQRALGDRLGIKQARVSEIEAGVGPQGPSFGLMQRIAEACGHRLFVEQLSETAELTTVAG
jgi:ribosome-binding protein aMBF1 (putative translation factor)